ncbi:MAG TPA: magnesium/cobalt transporter CorA [Candidatus Nanoarchaeia archaeon]|nr:magnesium/cobalt transporter CorA [Candidatus Nanoarchaeia archaeon]
MIEIFYFDGAVKKANVHDLEKVKAWPIWIDVTNITKKEAEVLRVAFDLHPLTVEDMLQANSRIKVEEFSQYVYCVFYGVEKRHDVHKGRPIGLVEIDFALGERFLISSHIGEIASFNELKNNTVMLEQLFRKSVDFIMHRLLDHEVDNYFPVLQSIDDQIEEIEEEVTKRPQHTLLARILSIKRTIVIVKKVALPQREKISVIAKTASRFVSKKAMPYYRDVHDHAVRVADLIDNYRENIGNTFDVYMSAVSNTTNEVMKVLSVMATLALPLTVISSIYGANFAILPGAENPLGFWIMIGFMAIVSSGMLLFFRSRHWF